MDFLRVVSHILPILLLMLLGNFMRHKGILKEDTISELKKVVVDFALPSLLFVAFLDIRLKASYLLIFLVVFAVTNFMFWYGKRLKDRLGVKDEYFAFLTSGFEYGMVGVALFGSVYGVKSVGYLGIIDIGQEMFVWFILLAALISHRDNVKSLKRVAKSFFESPVIIAILLGLFLNVLGQRENLYSCVITSSVLHTMRLLGNLTVPLILIVIGYGIKISKAAVRQALLVVGARFVVLIPLALFLNVFFIERVLRLDRIFEAALFTLFILPPPFIIPLYIRNDNVEALKYTNNVLMIYTLFSISVFIIYLFLTHGAIL